MQRPPKVVGIPWYTTENYRACLEIMADQEILPLAYQSWLEYAQEAAKNVEDTGGRLLRVFIDPAEFPFWCRARGLQPDARARTRYANFVAFRDVISSPETRW